MFMRTEVCSVMYGSTYSVAAKTLYCCQRLYEFLHVSVCIKSQKECAVNMEQKNLSFLQSLFG